jgi:hypothetical protein
MPTYMDLHDIPGVKAANVAGAHEADLKVQGKYGVDYKQYWVNESEGKVFCLVEAPNKESAARVLPRGSRPRGPQALRGHARYLTGRIVGNSLIRTRALP